MREIFIIKILIMEKITVECIKKLVGNKYDVISYNGSKKPVILSCPIHREFKLRLDHIKEHLNGDLCPYCIKEKEVHEKFLEFVRKGNDTHNGKYVYHEECFTNMSTKTIITCPIHGDFEQIANNHVWAKQGCPKCANERKLGKYKYTREKIIEMCKKTHGDKYIYDDIVFQGMKKKILNIKCPKHGYFDQIAYDHIKGFGCEQCKFENQTMAKDEFISRATELHNGFYKYNSENMIYVNNNIKVPIICPIHGEFWQRPAYHLMGGGCPHCQSSKLESELMDFFKDNGINFIHKFHTDWLGKQEIDLYLPNYNVGIECQGLQHFEEVKQFKGKDGLKERLERDRRKLILCGENNLKLLYYSNLGIEYPYQVFEDKEELLKEIRGTNG